MSKKINNIHDKYVRESFSDPKRAAASMEILLPEALRKELKLDALVVLQESYMDEQLGEYFSDLVFEVPLKGQGGKPLDIALLFEHKSAPDKHVLIQVGYYLFAHYHKCVVSKKPFKPILPIIYYQGKRKWEVPTLADLFASYPEDIKQFLPTINHIFIPLHSVPNATLVRMNNSMMAMSLIAQKHPNDPDKFEEDMMKIFSIFGTELIDRNFLQKTFVYILYTSGIETSEFKKIVETAPIPTTIKEEVMTTYAKLKQEGRQEGIQKGEQIGIQKGEQIGIQKGKIEVVLKSHDSGLSISLIANITGLGEEEVTKILKDHGKID